MRKLILSLCLIGIFSIKVVKSTIVNSCDDGTIFPSTILSINSYVCDQTPCTCIPGCPFRIQLEFNSPRYLENIKPSIIATYAGVSINYPLNQTDACDGLTNTQCPIIKNELIKYNTAMDILSIFPEVTVDLKFSIVDTDLTQSIVCVSFSINVKKTECPA